MKAFFETCFTKRKFILVLLSSIIIYIINFIITYYEVNIYDTINHPIIVISSIISLGGLKFAVKCWIEERLSGQVLFMDGPSQEDSIYDTQKHINCTPENSDPEHLKELDIAQIVKEGYIDPETGEQRKKSFQPWGRQLCNMLCEMDKAERSYHNAKSRRFIPINMIMFDNYQEKFIMEYMRYHYPNKTASQYFNTKTLRDTFFFLK